MQSQPILILNDDVVINCLLLDESGNRVIIGTSDGKIIKMDMLVANAYLTGNRSIFSQIEDGFGNISNVGCSNLTYQLKEQILKILENKTMTVLKQIPISFSASMLENKANAIFTSQVLNGGEDFIGWKSMEWKQIIPTGTTTTIYVRSHTTTNNLMSSNWYSLKYTDNAGSVSLSLDDLPNTGQYIQFKIVLSTSVNSITPSVYNLNIFYQTINATYLYTQKYILTKNTNTKSIILTANIIQPQYTEVKFGVSDGKTANWNDYYPLDLEKINEIPSTIKDRLKIGAKLITHVPYACPVINEFALIFKGDKENLLNKT